MCPVCDPGRSMPPYYHHNKTIYSSRIKKACPSPYTFFIHSDTPYEYTITTFSFKLFRLFIYDTGTRLRPRGTACPVNGHGVGIRIPSHVS